MVCSTPAAQLSLGDASRWRTWLQPRFAHHPDTGALDGVGLVTYPRKETIPEPPPAKLFTT
jgi:hypothetical protein